MGGNILEVPHRQGRFYGASEDSLPFDSLSSLSEEMERGCSAEPRGGGVSCSSMLGITSSNSARRRFEPAKWVPDPIVVLSRLRISRQET